MAYTSCNIYHDSLELCESVSRDQTLISLNVGFGSPSGSGPVHLGCFWPVDKDNDVKLRLIQLCQGGLVETSISRNVPNKRYLELDDCLPPDQPTTVISFTFDEESPGVWAAFISWPKVRFLRGLRVEGTAVTRISLKNGNLSWARSILGGTSVYDRERPGDTIWALSLASLQSTRVTVHCAEGCPPVLHVREMLVPKALERCLLHYRVYCLSFCSEDAELDARVACWNHGQAASLYAGPFDRDVCAVAREEISMRKAWVDANPEMLRIEWERIVEPQSPCAWMPPPLFRR